MLPHMAAPASTPARPTDGPAVTMTGVHKSFGPTQAVRGVSLTIAPGEMFGLIGPDGAGKTTTIRLLCGLLAPSSGDIRVLGLNPTTQHRELTRHVGYFSQRFSLYGDLTIDENIAFFADIHEVRDFVARRNRLLDMMQLTPFRDRLADRLSGGMKQKLALACTLVHEPRVVMLDEPTTGVDPVSRREFWRLLSEFLADGITIIMATPYLDEAERCSRVALISNGAVVALDTPHRLRADYPGDLIEVLAHPKPTALAILRSLPAITGVEEFGERLHAKVSRGRGSDTASAIHADLLAHQVTVVSVRPVPASLEDVFIDRVAPPRVPSEESA